MRKISIILMASGGILMFMAPQQAPWLGPVLLLAGMAVEVVGVAIERRKRRKDRMAD